MTHHKLKLMADYQCFPIWGSFENDEGNINPANLPITDELQVLLKQWQNSYDGMLDLDNPLQSGFKTREDEIAFEEQGLLIWQLLSAQIGEQYKVTYFSELRNREFLSYSDYNDT